MNNLQNIGLIIIADDDEDDRILIRDAFIEKSMTCDFVFAADGIDVMNYLNSSDMPENEKNAIPDLIILDLNMPRKNGKEVLKEIKANPKLKHIPVIIFSTSKSPEDLKLSYNLGASSFIVKPASFEGLLEIAETIHKYWFEIVSVRQVISFS